MAAIVKIRFNCSVIIGPTLRIKAPEVKHVNIVSDNVYDNQQVYIPNGRREGKLLPERS